jgi:cellobiose-specific phosphotransferase system component IIC
MDAESGLNFNAFAAVLIISLFASILLMMTIGQRLAKRILAHEADVVRSRLTGVETAIFGLMSLMIAFSFSSSAARYEMRWGLVVAEANAIGTAYLRLDLLPESSQPVLREKFRRYTEARIAVYHLLGDAKESDAQAAIATTLQSEIWTGTLTALKESPSQMTVVVIPALNQMFDVATTRAVMLHTHTPKLIFSVLVILGLICSLLAGYALADTHTRLTRLHLATFAVVVTLAIYVVFDLDYPRYGFIQLKFADRALVDLLAGMK